MGTNLKFQVTIMERKSQYKVIVIQKKLKNRNQAYGIQDILLDAFFILPLKAFRQRRGGWVGILWLVLLWHIGMISQC